MIHDNHSTHFQMIKQSSICVPFLVSSFRRSTKLHAATGAQAVACKSTDYSAPQIGQVDGNLRDSWDIHRKLSFQVGITSYQTYRDDFYHFSINCCTQFTNAYPFIPFFSTHVLEFYIRFLL